MYKNTLFILVFFVLYGCTTSVPVVNIEEMDVSEADSAFVALHLGSKSRYIKSFVFRHVDSNTNYEFLLNRREGESLLLSLPEGDYFLVRIETNFWDKKPVKFRKPENLLELRAGNMYYIGDISWKDDSVFVDFSKESVTALVKENKDSLAVNNVFVLNHLFGNMKTASVRPKSTTSISASESFDQIPCQYTTGGRNAGC